MKQIISPWAAKMALCETQLEMIRCNHGYCAVMVKI